SHQSAYHGCILSPRSIPGLVAMLHYPVATSSAFLSAFRRDINPPPCQHLHTYDNPLRVAEEVAMIDILSGGRVVCGFVRGLGQESLATNANPAYNRERFDEAHDVIVKAWTTPGPFRWVGRHYEYRVVNPWMRPLQKPHPPIWIPGVVSPESVRWA